MADGISPAVGHSFVGCRPAESRRRLQSPLEERGRDEQGRNYRGWRLFNTHHHWKHHAVEGKSGRDHPQPVEQDRDEMKDDAYAFRSVLAETLSNPSTASRSGASSQVSVLAVSRGWGNSGIDLCGCWQ
ncbi:MAG TPA: hypothetical protein VK638_50645 [Edaphobacter sp.]|nr:hypothetical protein [Edaphobacter sp.]